MEKKTVPSRTPILGLFITLLLLFAVPLIIFVSENRQDIRQRASSPQPTLNISSSPQDDNSISGYVYLDQNTDGERQYGEKGINNIQLKITQKNLITFVATDENGYFKYRFSNASSTPNNLAVKLILPEGYKTINTNPRLLTNIQNDTKNILEFGIYPINITPLTATKD